MDVCLYGKDQGIPAEEVAALAGIGREKAEQIYRMIASKRRMARYLHSQPLLVEEV